MQATWTWSGLVRALGLIALRALAFSVTAASLRSALVLPWAVVGYTPFIYFQF